MTHYLLKHITNRKIVCFLYWLHCGKKLKKRYHDSDFVDTEDESEEFKRLTSVDLILNQKILALDFSKVGCEQWLYTPLFSILPTWLVILIGKIYDINDHKQWRIKTQRLHQNYLRKYGNKITKDWYYCKSCEKVVHMIMTDADWECQRCHNIESVYYIMNQEQIKVKRVEKQ